MTSISEQVKRAFPVGCTVTFTPEAARMFPKYAKRLGRVVGISNNISPRVLWGGRKTPDAYTYRYLRKVSVRRTALSQASDKTGDATS